MIDQDVAAFLQVLDSREFHAPIEHILAGDPNLQAACAQPLIMGTHIKQDDVAVVAPSQFGRESEAVVGLVCTVDADQDAEPVAPLLVLLLQFLLKGRSRGRILGVQPILEP